MDKNRQESCTETVTVYKHTDNRGFRAVNGKRWWDFDGKCRDIDGNGFICRGRRWGLMGSGQALRKYWGRAYRIVNWNILWYFITLILLYLKLARICTAFRVDYLRMRWLAIFSVSGNGNRHELCEKDVGRYGTGTLVAGTTGNGYGAFSEKRKIRAITPFKIIQGYRDRYKAKARMRLQWLIVTNILSL